MNALRFICSYPSLPVLLVLLIGLMVRWQFVAWDRKRTELIVVLAMYGTMLGTLCGFVLMFLSRFSNVRYDLYVYKFDAFFGEPSFAIGRFLAAHIALQYILGFCYGIVPIVLVGVTATYLYFRTQREAFEAMLLFSINAVCSLPIYLLLPVSGPAFAFKNFPADQGIIIPHPIFLTAPPNCIPSVHFSTAILILWCLRHWPAGRIFGALYLTIMIAVTLGSGQHYLFDLICAVPYSYGVWMLTDSLAKRFAPQADLVTT